MSGGPDDFDDEVVYPLELFLVPEEATMIGGGNGSTLISAQPEKVKVAEKGNQERVIISVDKQARGVHRTMEITKEAVETALGGKRTLPTGHAPKSEAVVYDYSYLERQEKARKQQLAGNIKNYFEEAFVNPDIFVNCKAYTDWLGKEFFFKNVIKFQTINGKMLVDLDSVLLVLNRYSEESFDYLEKVLKYVFQCRKAM